MKETEKDNGSAGQGVLQQPPGPGDAQGEGLTLARTVPRAESKLSQLDREGLQVSDVTQTSSSLHPPLWLPGT